MVWRRAKLTFCLAGLTLSRPVIGQEASQQQKQVDVALQDLQGSAIEQAHAARVFQQAGIKDPRIIPALWTAFHLGSDKTAKAEIAVSLLLLHAIDDKEAFEYIAGFAWAAVKSDAPYPFLRDPSTNIPICGQLNSHYLNWCKQHNVDWEIELSTQMGYYADLSPLRYAKIRDRHPFLGRV